MDPKERDSDSYSDSDLRVQRQTSTPPFTPSRSRSPTPHQHYYQHEDRNQDQDQDQRNLHLAPPSSSASNPLNNSPLSTPPHTHTQSLLANLYTTHFLSTWNARGYEFGAVSLLFSPIFSPLFLLLRFLSLVSFEKRGEGGGKGGGGIVFSFV